MATKSDTVEQWERIQAKTFTNWVNSHLVKRGLKIEDVITGFTDGVNLVNLLEVISTEKIAKYEKNPKMRIHKVENVNKCLQFITEHGVKLAGTGASEIVDGNLKMTLGMIWTIILRFAISGLSEEGLSAKEGLLLWCRRKTEGYRGVDIKDFTMSFQDGLALCALIHRHRPDLINYDSLSAENKLDNLNLAFDVAKEHLDVARLLDAEDIVNMPRPDERSIMTYVAQLYQVFSSLDKVETAGRRVGKFLNFIKSVEEMKHDYEKRTQQLNHSVHSKVQELASTPLGNDYNSCKAQIGSLRNYKKNERRQWVAEQSDLATLFSNIQAKLKSMNRPPYNPPAELTVQSVESNMQTLAQAERERRANLNHNLRSILETLRQAFAEPANALAAQLQSIRAGLADAANKGDFHAQLEFCVSTTHQLNNFKSQLPHIQNAENACIAANIEDNEHSDHTYDDLEFELAQLSQNYSKKIIFLESQIEAAKEGATVPAEKIQEFRQTFAHFDTQNSGRLSKLEFKSCLSSLGVVELDFEGGNAVFESIFERVSHHNDHITFENFVEYMVSLAVDSVTPEQLNDSFATVAGNKDFITLNDMRVAQLTHAQIEYLTSTLPAHSSIEGAYDYKAWLSSRA
eukprot:TRINITY_DN121_c0_g3_i1.p1 TRINITY_DN121_c0_g3~~TRINITY_DN121_c0_g3_i1.p1  ORF type:complete len:629 (-),score=334.80 TRINITY_DN121_c0_g3_i1:157-2043(-)